MTNSEAAQLLRRHISEIESEIVARELELDQLRERQETLFGTIRYLEEEHALNTKEKNAARKAFVEGDLLKNIRKPTKDAGLQNYKDIILARSREFNLSDIIVVMRGYGFKANHMQARRAIKLLGAQVKLVHKGSGRRPSTWLVNRPITEDQKISDDSEPRHE